MNKTPLSLPLHFSPHTTNCPCASLTPQYPCRTPPLMFLDGIFLPSTCCPVPWPLPCSWPTSRPWDVCSHTASYTQKCPTLSWMLWRHCLQILSNFEQGVLHFHFATGLANFITSSDSGLPVRTAPEDAEGLGVSCPPGQGETSLCSTLNAFPKRID